jgi:hypothetical protein
VLMLLAMAVQSAVEITPSLDSLTLSTGVSGTCITHPLQPATIRLDWTSTGFNGAGQDYKVYRDGILVATTDSTVYSLQLAGLVENDTHNSQNITFNYRVDIVRKHYGNCV